MAQSPATAQPNQPIGQEPPGNASEKGPVPEVERSTRAITLVFRGRFRVGIGQWTYLPFSVPACVRRITVSASHGRLSFGNTVRNALDLGMFGPEGRQVGETAGFRGYSGAARTGFTISADDATPGYLPGPIEPGTWNVLLGPLVLSPLGMRWQVRVEMELDTAGEPAGGPGWYRGDLHLHTVHSDGDRSPEELAAAARAAGLDYIVSTEHNTNAANLVWVDCRRHGLVVIAGQEVSTRYGHWLAIGVPPDRWIDWRYTPREHLFAQLADQVHDDGGLVVPAHPAMPLPSGWWAFGHQKADALQIWNGRWTVEDELALRLWHRQLRRGRRLVVAAGTDSHTRDQPVGQPQTVVHATALTTSALIEGLRAGRAYLAESSAVTLELAAATGTTDADRSTAGPGETLTVPGDAPVTVTAAVKGAPNSRIAVITATGTAARADIDRSGTHRLCWTTTGSAARFVRVEVRHRGLLRRFAPMAALSNPIWLQSGSPPAA